MQRTIVSAALLLALAAPAHAAEGGLQIFPDIALGASPLESRFVQLLILFVLLIFPVNQLLLKPLLAVLDERAARIEGTRKRAGELVCQAVAQECPDVTAIALRIFAEASVIDRETSRVALTSSSEGRRASAHRPGTTCSTSRSNTFTFCSRPFVSSARPRITTER